MTARTFIVCGWWLLTVASCTMREQDTPALTGPSELAVSIVVGAQPDVLPTDGTSQSLITVTAHDAYGRPLRNLSVRAETLVNGQPADLGALVPRNTVTDASGRATVSYTAPAIDGDLDTGARVQIGITPAGTNFASALTRTATIRLVPNVPIR
jgi:hypothetical protein